MDGVWVCTRILKIIQEREALIHGMLMNNELSDMAQYRALMGEITALGAVSQEISEMLERGEEHDEQGTVLAGPFGQ
jgi:hypothetical protein